MLDTLEVNIFFLCVCVFFFLHGQELKRKSDLLEHDMLPFMQRLGYILIAHNIDRRRVYSTRDYLLVQFLFWKCKSIPPTPPPTHCPSHSTYMFVVLLEGIAFQ